MVVVEEVSSDGAARNRRCRDFERFAQVVRCRQQGTLNLGGDLQLVLLLRRSSI